MEATVRDEPANNHSAGSRVYDWEGFELWDYEGETMEPDVQAFRLVVITDAVGDIDVSAPNGVTVGLDGATVEAQAYRTSTSEVGGAPLTFSLLDETPVEIEAMPDYEPAALSVRVWIEGDVVTRIDAPSRNWGP